MDKQQIIRISSDCFHNSPPIDHRLLQRSQLNMDVLTIGNDGDHDGYIRTISRRGVVDITQKTKPLLVWLRNKKTDRKSQSYTLLSMDGWRGGMFSLATADDEEKFLLRYAQELDWGDAFKSTGRTRLYLCECRTTIFRFYVDIDTSFVKTNYYFSDAKKKLICRIIDRTIRLFYPSTTADDTFLMLVSDTTEFDKSRVVSTTTSACLSTDADHILSDDEELSEHISVADKDVIISSNMHINFPNLHVNQEQSIVMGKAIASKLYAIIGTIEGMTKDWFDVVDPSVYLKNGLRMPGSRKCAKCPDCKNQRGVRKCTGNKCKAGKLDLGKVYKLRWITQGNRVFVDHEALTNTFIMVKMCSIRSNRQQPIADWAKYAGCPDVDLATLAQFQSKKDTILGDPDIAESKKLQQLENLTNKPVDLNRFQTDRDGQKIQRSCRVEIDASTNVFKEIVQLVNSFHVDYKNTAVKSISTTDAYTYYRALLVGEGSSVCQNLSSGTREHKNNTVYMIIKPSGVQQHCWCSCATIEHRKYGSCANFQSEKKPLTMAAKIVLFPSVAGVKQNKFNLGSIIPRNVDDAQQGMNNVLAYFHYKGYVMKPAAATKKHKPNK